MAAAFALQPAHAIAADCELRVFPTDQVSVITNLETFGLVGNILSGRDQPKEIFLRDLPADSQTKTIAEIAGLSTILKFPEAEIIREQSPISYRTAKKKMDRLTSSSKQCYAELVVASIMYTDNVVKGKRIGALMLFRRFDQDRSIPRVQELGGSGKLTLYPTREADQQAAAKTELAGAFRAAVIEGATKFLR